MDELQVLLDQLEEMLGEGATDYDDAIEIAMVAGMAARLGATGELMQRAVAWREGPGRELLDTTFRLIDDEGLRGAIDDVMDGESSDERVEEVLFDVDEVIAAAIWCGQQDQVRALARSVAQAIRQVPDPFACVADTGADMARQPAIAAHLDLYDFWLAVADAAEWS